MARHQYRVVCDNPGTTFFGNAFLAIVNPSGSGRKLKIRSIEPQVQSIIAAATGMYVCLREAYKATSGSQDNSGVDITDTGVKTDSAYGQIPFRVLINGSSAFSKNIGILRRQYVNLGRRASSAINSTVVNGSLSSLGANHLNNATYMFGRGKRSGVSSLEPITFLPHATFGTLACICEELANGASVVPIRVNLVVDTANFCDVHYEFCTVARPGQEIFKIVSTLAQNTYPVRIKQVTFTNFGSADTPTLFVVPIGQLYAEDVGDKRGMYLPQIQKMDTSAPNPPSNMECYSDISFIPSGVPAKAINDGSPGGTPKGFNYLHAKDFAGPLYRSMLVELNSLGRPNASTDDLGMAFGHRACDILGRRAGITLSPGEGIAIVNAAETAVGGASLIPAAGGWAALSFAMQIDDEDLITPQLTIQSSNASLIGAEIRIYDLDGAGNSFGTEISGVESCSSSTYSYTGTYNNTILVQIFKSGYIESNTTLTLLNDLVLDVALVQDNNA